MNLFSGQFPFALLGYLSQMYLTSDRISFTWVEMCDGCKKKNCTYTHILQVLSIKGALFFLQRRPKDPAPSFRHIAVHYSSGPVGFVDVPQYVET